MGRIMKHAGKLEAGGRVSLLESGFILAACYGVFAVLVHAGGMAGHTSISKEFGTLVLHTLGTSPALVLQFAAFGLTVLALNLIPLIALLASMRVAGPFIQRLKISRFTYFSLAVLCLWVGVLALNGLLFPKSTFVFLLPRLSDGQLAWLGGVALGAFAAMGVLPAAWRLLQWGARLAKKPVLRYAAGAALVVGVAPPLFSHWAPPHPASGQPNIIIIGLDSVSPQHLQRHPGAFPILESLLRESTVFTQSVTPLARTFPAWTGILTAKYPVHSGARFNLTAFDQVDTARTLPKLLKARGYTAIYAQDERKFNNIDEHFGFDATVGPQPGAAEFALVKAADQPLVNLALLTPWTQRLFPFVALNRASPVQYEPDEFVDAIVRRLPEDASQPLFLAAHFCLAHHPYTWRDQGAWPGGGNPSLEQKHVFALQELERQIDRLLKSLKTSGRLDNAIVVLLSDHGESMGYADGLWVAREKNAAPEGEPTQVGAYRAFAFESGFDGHGANVLDRTQNLTLLAFQAYGPLKHKFPSGTRERLASLVDIMPTLFHALDLKAPSGLDGLDLMADQAVPRVVPNETGIRFDALSSVVDVDEDALLAESKAYYRVEPATARLIVKPERYAGLVSTKDIALHTDDWILALLRKDGSPHFARVALLVHKPSGAWTLGQDKALIARAPVNALREAAKNLYAGELNDFAGTWVFN